MKANLRLETLTAMVNLKENKSTTNLNLTFLLLFNHLHRLYWSYRSWLFSQHRVHLYLRTLVNIIIDICTTTDVKCF